MLMCLHSSPNLIQIIPIINISTPFKQINEQTPPPILCHHHSCWWLDNQMTLVTNTEFECQTPFDRLSSLSYRLFQHLRVMLLKRARQNDMQFIITVLASQIILGNVGVLFQQSLTADYN